MPTDTARPAIPAGSFTLRFLAWSIGLFGLLRLTWIEANGVLPVTRLQGQIATRLSGLSALPVDVTLACSAADATALCLGAVLAYPAPLRMRVAGAGGGLAVILLLNTLRIATLGRAAASPPWFEALHFYVWPLVLLLAIAGYVFAWMRLAGAPGTVVRAQPRDHDPEQPTVPIRRFVAWTVALLVVFTAASPWYLQSPAVLAVAAFIASAAAVALRALGIEATAAGNILSTARGALLVTEECVSTPLIPVYLAAVLAYWIPWRRRALPLLAALPIFVGLAIARLLVVAVPVAIAGSPLFLVHAFYQLALAGLVVILVAAWRHGAGTTAWSRALAGATVGGAIVYLLGPATTLALTSAFAATPLEDPQGATALLPAFQIGLYVALCIAAFSVARWRSALIGLGVLGVSQVVVFAALHFVLGLGGAAPHVRDVRAWALAAPLLVVLALVSHDHARR